MPKPVSQSPKHPGNQSAWQPVIGLEIHVQLSTESKVFATENSGFQKKPNHHVSAISFAHPGALPSINLSCIQLATRIGLATQCKINQETRFARKNYFYPDLPKGYQLSQDKAPICYKGCLRVPRQDGSEIEVRIHQIHIEEDAGKSIHDQHPKQTLIDLNRAGVGLIEIVTEPDIRSASDAGATVAEIRRIVRYLGVSDGNMETGNLRCDANISIMPQGSTTLGTRVEIKNINSISYVMKAIEYEIERQIQWVESGGKVVQETRTWNVQQNRSQPMRDKETADDYRYFPEPDLLPVHISDEDIQLTQQKIPSLPSQRFRQYFHEYKLPINESITLIEDKVYSDYFEELVTSCGNPKRAANWMLGSVRTYLIDNQTSIESFPLTPQQLSSLIKLVQEDKISHHSAKEELFPRMLAAPDQNPLELAQQLDLLIMSKENELEQSMIRLIEKYPEEVSKYRGGKKKLLGFFVGKLMREFKGKINPKEANAIVQKKLQG